MSNLKLHLGCGDKKIEGYVNIDIRYMPNVDVVEDIRTLKSIKEETVSVIYVSHVLEHFGRLEYKEVLKRWCSLLVPKGILRLAVPDLESVFEYYQETKDLSKIRGFLYGGQDYKENYHYCGWDYKTLEEDLIECGFSSVSRYDWRTTEHSSIDDYSQCYLPHLDKENGRLMSLNVEAVK